MFWIKPVFSIADKWDEDLLHLVDLGFIIVSSSCSFNSSSRRSTRRLQQDRLKESVLKMRNRRRTDHTTYTTTNIRYYEGKTNRRSSGSNYSCPRQSTVQWWLDVIYFRIHRRWIPVDVRSDMSSIQRNQWVAESRCDEVEGHCVLWECESGEVGNINGLSE